MSFFSKTLRDVFSLVLIILVMAIGVLGVVLPYRNIFTQAGAYQLEAFDSGLAFYHYGLNGQQPFYRVSPLDDFIEAKQASRSTHLSRENFELKEYSAKWQEAVKPLAILGALKQFAGEANPWYEMESEGLIVRYEAVPDGEDWLINKTIVFDQPTYVINTAMTLNFFRDSLVLDGNNGQIYQSRDQDQIEDRVLSSGSVHIINSDSPGYLTVIASNDQQVYVNKPYGLVEVVEPVNQVISELTQTMRIKAHDGRQQ